ncbi:lysophospholipase L1-like esterase [Pseudacidovorax sp. 1753]|uniref:hypothetical protein n=1 Tax=Pseudacidovorax sp. 1753 TaxID=3156419 RepID=UPI00339ABCF9
MGWYRTGTITLVAGSDVVLGAGTAWVRNALPGDILSVPGAVLEVKRIVSDGELQLATAYTGAGGAGLSYALVPTQGYVPEALQAMQQILGEFGDIWQAWQAGDLQGRGLVLKGAEDAVEDLPAEGNTAGDGYVVAGSQLYVWNGMAWAYAGEMITTPELIALKQAALDAQEQAALSAAAAEELKGQTQSLVEVAAAKAQLATTAAASAQSSSRTRATWAGEEGLAALTPTAVGQGAEVLDSDLGTHIDPSTSAVVPNAGRYTAFATTVGGWKRIDGTGLAGKVNVTDLSKTLRDNDPALTGLAFAVTDADGRRLWIEAGMDGKPTGRVLDLIGAGLTPSRVPGLGLEGFTKPEEIDPALNDIGFAMVDSAKRRLWLEADMRGGPTARALDLIGAGLTRARMTALDLADKLSALGADEALNDIGIALVDGANRRTWLECDMAGRPTARALQLIAVGIGGVELNAPARAYRPTWSNVERPIVSGPNIICWGDSLTAGAGGGGTNYPGVLQALLTTAGFNVAVRNGGVGGESSVTIAARTGANPFLLLPQGGAIPAAAEPVRVDLQKINGQTPVPLLQGTGTPGSSFVGSLAGVPGLMQLVQPNGPNIIWDPANYYVFTRSTAGAVVTCNRPAPYRTDFSEARRGDIVCGWIGQNGPSNARAIQDALAIERHLSALKIRTIWISKPGGTSAADPDDAEWAATFGRRHIAIRPYLVAYGLADAGLAPTSQDTADMAAGAVPSSLRVDGVHLNAAGYAVVAQQVFQRILELGYMQ